MRIIIIINKYIDIGATRHHHNNNNNNCLCAAEKNKTEDIQNFIVSNIRKRKK